MRRSRWLAPWKLSPSRLAIYHCISRVVDRAFVLGTSQKEKFRALMRIYEKFSGCRVLAYCLMDNHFHLLLEVPPLPQQGLSDHELLHRLSALYLPDFVQRVEQELLLARLSPDPSAAASAIHQRFTYRMHDLGQFMKGLLQRYTQWHNRTLLRRGRLWEDRFKSLLVEDGAAARTIAAYIDLNPVRAGLVDDPADYRWSSYGEAIGGNPKGQGRTARAGLVRLWHHEASSPPGSPISSISSEASRWPGEIARAYRRLLMEQGLERPEATHLPAAHGKAPRRGIPVVKVQAELQRLKSGESPGESSGPPDLPLARLLRHRIRYFTDGAVIGSRSFVEEAFRASRERFGPRRQSGARRLRGPGSSLTPLLWSMRDLKKGLGEAVN